MYVFPPMRNKMKNPDILVVGGGASGIIAAITAARRGASVTVLERGKKPLHRIGPVCLSRNGPFLCT